MPWSEETTKRVNSTIVWSCAVVVVACLIIYGRTALASDQSGDELIRQLINLQHQLERCQCDLDDAMSVSMNLSSRGEPTDHDLLVKLSDQLSSMEEVAEPLADLVKQFGSSTGPVAIIASIWWYTNRKKNGNGDKA